MPSVNPETPFIKTVQLVRGSLSEENLTRMLALYRGKTWKDVRRLVEDIRIIDCNKEHERILESPEETTFQFYECGNRPSNAACGHCNFSPLGNQRIDIIDDEDLGLSARQILEDIILVLRGVGQSVDIPDDLVTRIVDASVELGNIDWGAVSAYASHYEGVPEDELIGSRYDYSGGSIAEIARKVNEAARPHGEPIMRLKAIVEAKLEELVPGSKSS